MAATAEAQVITMRRTIRSPVANTVNASTLTAKHQTAETTVATAKAAVTAPVARVQGNLRTASALFCGAVRTHCVVRQERTASASRCQDFRSRVFSSLSLPPNLSIRAAHCCALSRWLGAVTARKMPPLLASGSRNCAVNVVCRGAGKVSMANVTRVEVSEDVSARRNGGKKLGGMLMRTPSLCGEMLHSGGICWSQKPLSAPSATSSCAKS